MRLQVRNLSPFFWLQLERGLGVAYMGGELPKFYKRPSGGFLAMQVDYLSLLPHGR